MFAVALLLAFTPLPEVGLAVPPLPPLSDLARFPDVKNVDVRSGILMRQQCALYFQPASAERDAAIRQVDHAIECWMTLQEAHDSKADLARRQALEQLLHLLGDEDYRRGRMP